MVIQTWRNSVGRKWIGSRELWLAIESQSIMISDHDPVGDGSSQEGHQDDQVDDGDGVHAVAA